MSQKSETADVTTSNRRRLCVVTPYVPSLTETFIREHIEKLPAVVTHIHGWRPTSGSRNILSFPTLALYKARRTLTGAGLEQETAVAYQKAFRSHDIEVILAEYGDTGVLVMEAARRANIPLVVHFHGYDASVKSVLDEHLSTYPRMFGIASPVIAVSKVMHRKLIELGAPKDKVHYNPCGVDCELFGGAKPEAAPPTFLAVGRFSEKKAPAITLSAFAQVLKVQPKVRLRMIGEGPLLNDCRTLASNLQIDHAVTFLGGRDPSTVQEEMRKARCFVQHSLVAPSGDSEGTPVSIIEAGATGLPVVSTRHAGIPDVVIEGETGFLVDEGDTSGMAQFMMMLAQDAALAGRLGAAGNHRVKMEFNREKRLGKLWEIIESCIVGRTG